VLDAKKIKRRLKTKTPYNTKGIRLEIASPDNEPPSLLRAGEKVTKPGMYRLIVQDVYLPLGSKARLRKAQRLQVNFIRID